MLQQVQKPLVVKVLEAQRTHRKSLPSPSAKLPTWRNLPKFDLVGTTPEGHPFGLTLYGYNPKYARERASALPVDPIKSTPPNECTFSPALRSRGPGLGGFPGIQTIGHGARLHRSSIVSTSSATN